MLTPHLEKRRRVMQRSIALGHCICDVKQPCPCETFKLKGVCLCAGERVPADESAPIKLTEHVRNAGCASKIDRSALKEVLQGLPQIDDPRVLVGAAAGDDAGVMVLGSQGATILTVDVFSPAVDDPYTFGQIAAANSLSDIYAMGGEPQAALSIIGFPIHSLPASAMREILRGGIEKMREAGVPVVGGHSINDAEIKCGFAVIGASPKDGYVRNAGAQVGDAIVLTKPIGTGIIVFAHQVGLSLPGAIDAAAQSMMRLNRRAGELMTRLSAHAATDITGFSLIGHLAEIVRNSGVEVEIDFDRLPLFKGVADLAERDVLPGAVERNRESVDEAMLDLSRLTQGEQATLFCPETSGGLLIVLPAERAEVLVRELHESGETSACIIGRVVGTNSGGFIRATASASKPEGYFSATTAKPAPASQPPPAAPCCPSPPQRSEESQPAGTDGALPAPAAKDAFGDYMAAVAGNGDSKGSAIDARHKKLIALALSVSSRCEPCIRSNARAAREAGAGDAEISEAVALGIAFGGAPAAMFYHGLRRM